jgi:hypothetical protein
MTTQTASQLREQALALLRIEREQWLERFGSESEKKGSASIQSHTAGSQPRRSLSTGRLFAIRRTTC